MCQPVRSPTTAVRLNGIISLDYTVLPLSRKDAWYSGLRNRQFVLILPCHKSWRKIIASFMTSEPVLTKNPEVASKGLLSTIGQDITTFSDPQIDRRSRIETYFDVLCTIANGVEKPTHIMYKANLSWKMTQLYTSSLISKGFVVIEERGGKKRYRLTEKGNKVAQQYLAIKEDLDLISEKHR